MINVVGILLLGQEWTRRIRSLIFMFIFIHMRCYYMLLLLSVTERTLHS